MLFKVSGAMKLLRIVSILLATVLLLVPANAKRGSSLIHIGKGRARHAAPLLIVLPPPLGVPKPAAAKITFKPHDVAHTGPRLGVKFFENGLRVALVDANSPASNAGLAPNDIVRKADRRAVKSHADFAAAINAAIASGRLRLSVLRAGKIRNATISLAATVAR
jgi:S1-C subfamily serine protease